MSKGIISQKSISASLALKACEFAVEKAKSLDISINVSVVDNKGLELAFLRMDNAFIHSIQIAKDKAYTSVSFGFPSGQWSEIFKNAPHLEQGFSNRDRLIPFGGGLPIFFEDEKIGGIGISGGSEEEDIVCAKYAIEKIGFEK